jgi:3-oxoacyl-[acyl-carrier protein] reductase
MPAMVIIGAAGGIGSELCRRLADAGHDLLLAGRTKEKLDSLANELNAQRPGQYRVMECDATQSANVDAVFSTALEAFGTISGATCLVGSILLKPSHLTTDAEFFETIAKNLHTAFFMVRAAAKSMSAGGSIVLASTVAATIGLANHEAIAAAKGGINGLTLSAAATYAGKNIRVNAVAPGLVRTPLAAKITSSEIALKASTAMHPLGRIGEPSDVANVIAFLLDPANSWITGQIIGIDGGLGSVRGK